MGFNEFVKAYRPDYAEEINRLAFLLVNDPPEDHFQIAERLQLPRMIVEHYLELYENNELVRLSQFAEWIRLDWVSAELKRMLSED